MGRPSCTRPWPGVVLPVGIVLGHVGRVREGGQPVSAEGTGHGRNALPTVSAETARVVVQAAGLLSALLLDTLDTRYARR